MEIENLISHNKMDTKLETYTKFIAIQNRGLNTIGTKE